MTLACIACSTTLPVGMDRAGRLTRCPWCGAVGYLGVKAEAPPVTAPETPILLTRDEPILTPVRANQTGVAREWLAGAGIIAALLLVLLGMSWFLASRMPANPAPGPELASAELSAEEAAV